MKIHIHANIYRSSVLKRYEVTIYNGDESKETSFKYQVDAINYLIRNGFKLVAIHGKSLDSEMWFTREVE